MSTSSDQPTSDHGPVNRNDWTVRNGRLGDAGLESGLMHSTPEERLGLVWPLTLQAWAFKEVDVAESRLP